MKEKKEIDVVKCDCCQKEIKLRTFFTNNGEYQADYVEKYGIDLCFICSVELFDKCEVEENSFKKIFKQIKEKKAKPFSSIKY